MATDELPTEYDDIVIGTGVQESIVAAALARNGHKVLHVDRNDFYSGEWASFHLKGMLDWIKRNQSTDVDKDEVNEQEADVEDGLVIVPLPTPHRTATNIEVEIHVKKEVDEVGGPDPAINLDSKTVESEAPHLPGSSIISGAAPHDGEEETKTSSHDGEEETKTSSQDGEEETKTSSHDGEEETKTSSQDGEEETNTSSQDVINTDNSNDDSLEMVQNQSPTTLPKDESANEVRTADQPSTHHGNVSTKEKQRDWTWEEIMKNWRKFNIDLAPKLMFCRGAMVELLVSSRISRYAEFKAVTRILTHISGRLEQVPCSRADVFSSRYVSMLEKRMLMKLIEFGLDHENRQDEYRDYMDKPFADFLQSRKLSPTLQHFVIHSIAMTSANTPTHKALQAMKYFLSSLGRYGNTAFLWTLYGSGELPQCFCRMCAVFGGIYVLRTSISSMITDSENNIRGIIDSEGKRLKCRNLILEHSYAYGESKPYKASYLSRGILITDRSIKQSTTEQITFLTIPPCDDRDQPVHVIEVGYAACAAPPNLYIVHLTAKANSKGVSAKDDLQHTVQTFFQVASKDCKPTEPDTDQPHILWSVYFSQEDVTDIEDDVLKGTLPGNVHVTSGAGGSIGFDHAVSQAKKIFEKLCPGEEFLPPAPDPEDLVFEDSANENTSQAGFDSNGVAIEEKETVTPEEEKETVTPEGGKETVKTEEEEKETVTPEGGKETVTPEEEKETVIPEEEKETVIPDGGKETVTPEEEKETVTPEEEKETVTPEEEKETVTTEEEEETGKETALSEEIS
ncbi:rab proteins geranylgeranyltransferase component A 2 isoform X1 [Strongylocentrotus purpuratus]|uniref:Rab proteins geranylgeranyltransferase component A n=1 Tax=Strongylocentrotus purpuratus TaxID=7668 RepID=A0A7M7PUA3_STRPU|nr:rab proteins geranylgeranyltransferase component A 2 isoform X1 [Strongylocentrotus purpuratus]XP_030856377.1 rab proteins geranylgeranyltransferase component A 2 isoform X1 [Strongylocentrotus purpuratus]